MSPNPLTHGKTIERLYYMMRTLSAELELRPALRKALAFTLETVGAQAASIVVVNEEGKIISAAIMKGDQFYDNTFLQMREVLRRGLAGWVLQHGEAVLLPDTSQDERWLPLLPEGAATDRRSAIAVPLVTKGQMVGVFTVVHAQPHAFTEEHLAWVRAIADFVSTIVMNAILYAQSRRQARLMQMWAESGTAITRALENTDTIIETTLEQINRTLRTEAAALVTREPQKGTWLITEVSGQWTERLLGVRLPEGEDETCPPLKDLEALGVKHAACVPIKGKGTARAIIAVNPLVGEFSAAMMAAFEGIALFASAALAHARLLEDTRAAYAQYRGLFNDTLDWIFITNMQGQVVEANQQAKEHLGYRWEILRSGTLSISEVHTLPQAWDAAQLHDIPASPPTIYESEVRTASGQIVPVEVYVRQVELQGRPHLQWILRDITERKQLDTLQNDLLAMLYHDLRAPMAIISMSLELLGQTCDDPESADLVNTATRAVERLAHLTSNLLDLNRLESGKMPLDINAESPATLLQAAVETIRARAEQREHTLEVKIAEGLPLVQADHEIIRRVLVNLLENAVKYSPEGSHITVGATSEDAEAVRFWVKDTGPGIPKEEQERIFEKYRRGRASRAKGLGLGLAFARLAVQAHGGTIGVSSEVGQGATFYFTLPTAPDTPEM